MRRSHKTFVLATSAAIALTVAISTAAQADVQFMEHGSVGYLVSHRIHPEDVEQVRAFLDQPRAQPLRIIYLDSRGGNPEAGMAIGRMIRERGLDTGFHVGRARCVSTCTAMFLGGVHRYYVGAEHVRDAAGTRVGLGFHPPRRTSEESEEVATDYYREMGAPGATGLRYRLSPRDQLDQPFQGVGRRGAREMFFAGTHTALRAGVATGTRPPAGLRDE